MIDADGDTQHDRKHLRFVKRAQLEASASHEPTHVLVARRRDAELARPQDERPPDLGDRRATRGEPFEVLDESCIESGC